MAERSPERSSVRKLGGKAPKAKRKTKAKTRHSSGPSAADLRRELSRRTVELAEARERQAATTEVLQVISSSRGKLGPVFEAMLANAMRICTAQCGFIYKMEAGAMRAMAEIGVPPAFAEYRRQHLHTGGATTPVDLMRATKKPAHVPDARESDAYRTGNPNAVAGVELGGARTVLYVPMIRDDNIVGVINLYRQEVRPFTTEQISLLESFASQAIIAIENAHLFEEVQRQTRDLSESLQQQTATAEVLGVISGSFGDLVPVFNAMLGKAMDLCAADFGVLNTFDPPVAGRTDCRNSRSPRVGCLSQRRTQPARAGRSRGCAQYSRCSAPEERSGGRQCHDLSAGAGAFLGEADIAPETVRGSSRHRYRKHEVAS